MPPLLSTCGCSLTQETPLKNKSSQVMIMKEAGIRAVKDKYKGYTGKSTMPGNFVPAKGEQEPTLQ